MTAPASPSVPAKAPAMPAMHTPREYTLPGIRDAWVREKLRQMLAHIAACQRGGRA